MLTHHKILLTAGERRLGLRPGGQHARGLAGSVAAMSEVEETLERVKIQAGVDGYVICSKQGQVLRRLPSMTQAQAEIYADFMSQLSRKARGVVRDLNPKNELRWRSRVRRQTPPRAPASRPRPRPRATQVPSTPREAPRSARRLRPGVSRHSHTTLDAGEYLEDGPGPAAALRPRARPPS